MTDNLAAEIARHQSSECEGHESYCLRCEEPWPCLVRRLADRETLWHEGHDVLLEHHKRTQESEREQREALTEALEEAMADGDVAREALKAIRLLLDAAEAASQGPARGGGRCQVTTTDRLEA